MRITKEQRRVLSLLRRGYRLGSYFAPAGRWSLAKSGKSVYFQGRTIRSMHRKGLIGGNIFWPYVTALGWRMAKEV